MFGGLKPRRQNYIPKKRDDDIASEQYIKDNGLKDVPNFDKLSNIISNKLKSFGKELIVDYTPKLDECVETRENCDRLLSFEPSSHSYAVR